MALPTVQQIHDHCNRYRDIERGGRNWSVGESDWNLIGIE